MLVEYALLLACLDVAALNLMNTKPTFPVCFLLACSLCNHFSYSRLRIIFIFHGFLLSLFQLYVSCQMFGLFMASLLATLRLVKRLGYADCNKLGLNKKYHLYQGLCCPWLAASSLKSI